MQILKAHAYGNDFLLVREEEVHDRDPATLARAVCDRHRGLGADGLGLFHLTPRGATMRLLNADGSPAEVSGNGVRCLAATLVWQGHRGREVIVDTDAGPKALALLDASGTRYAFRAAMGQPADLRRLVLEAGGERIEAVTLRVGNPQCVVLGPVDEARLHRLGPALTCHPAFPAGTNVELAEVESPTRVRILIWERGVGPTESSGTGSCAAAVAAARYGGASRVVDVQAPGGTQRVEWCEDGIYLTGWAEVLLEGQWLG